MERGFDEDCPFVEELKRTCQTARGYDSIRTQFVRDRLKETKFEDRGYIDVLMHLEDSVALSMRKQSPGPAGGMMYALMSKDYPVEYECIRREMKEGIRTSFDEFINMQVDHDRAVTQREIDSVERGMQEEEKRRRKEAELEQRWRELGGKG